jgi:transcription elongation factor GreA
MNKKHKLTEKGLKKVKKELEQLTELKKKKMKGNIPEVLHSEDLNPEYLDFRQKMELLEKKIGKLEEIIKHAEIIAPPKNKNKIDLGAKILFEADGQEDHFIIVDSIEADPDQGKISDESLVGKNLIGKKVGDEVKISSRIKTVYKIKDIKY